MSESYLRHIRNELEIEVDRIAQDDRLSHSQVVNLLWRFMEEKLKESFRNGEQKGRTDASGENPLIRLR